MIHSYHHRHPVLNRPILKAKPAGKSLWQKLVDRLVMDGPAEWDIHPDVAKKLADRERISHEIS